MEMVSVPVTLGLTFKVSVTIESQPLIFCSVAVVVPAWIKVCPFHVYGNAPSHIVMVSVPVTFGLTFNVRVTIESHPLIFCKIAVAVPGWVKLCPFQL